MIRVVAFDADDTLWHNERLFVDTQERFYELLARHVERDILEQRLFDTEVRNLAHYGYGVKSFTLSMIETAIELTEGAITGFEVEEILRLGREMLLAPVELIEGVTEAIEDLTRDHDLMVVTMGDLLDQETKLARSGLGEHFTAVEIVSRKDRATYETLVADHGLRPAEFVMIGNSRRSDILPVAEMGAWAIHVPYETTWAHEQVTAERMASVRYETVRHIGDVPDLVRALPT